MFEIKDYIKRIVIDAEVLETLKETCRDRLGPVIRFELKEYPNEDVSAIKTLEWFKHILALVGYQYEHIAERKFEEQAECWISRSFDFKNTVIVRHKYWSYEKTKTIFAILEAFCKNTGIAFSVEKL